MNTTVETFYVDGFQYKGDNLQFFPHAEGYVNCNAPKLLLVPTTDGGLQEVYLDDGTPTFSYVYNYTDHLGNIRLSYTKNPQSGALSIIEENQYYPFGLKHNNYNSDKNMYAKEQEQLKIKPVPPLFKPAYNYKYNGKELQDELGLNFYDYGARNYDPALGRFFNMDRFSEKYYDINPYQYCVNNPVRFIDIKGDSISVDKSLTENWGLNKAMTIFAATKAGRRFLSKFASKGQTIFGQTFDKDGKYDKAGLNIEFTTLRKEENEYGMPAKGETDNDGYNTITVALNTYEKVDAQDDETYDYRSPNAVTAAKNMSKWIFSRVMTAFHETFIHADLSAKDFMDNRKFDNSNILWKPKTYETHWQHSQVLYNNGNNQSWPNDAYKGIIEANSAFGQFYTNNQLQTMMWNYSGGKPTN
ncbi:RHS repeat-associated core domain-containing protein [Flavobacterium sp. SUN046]|uniref:RHS repeat domain-containing protein n=1 Tax=Flavobacterium sp. SUN046 TaxID=3002440 RepID=UPI002DB9192C|nr:RHS repeat-associated core domain-containing protein [Flavobacterium sp. SUN046]MEC4048613.1 RHS repeat-associated core domain-containing protein [Flavobacterium sp. SUN046]